MMIDLLNLSLKKLFYLCSCKLSLKTVLILTDQLIFRLEYIHVKLFIYHDIKSKNFLMSVSKWDNQMNMISFKLIKKYSDSQTHCHILYSKNENKNSTEMTHYVSIHSHLRLEQFCCDDMKSLDYVMLYFLCDSLLWQELKIVIKKQKYNLIMKKKKIIFTENLCYDLLNEFVIYLDYTQSLSFEDKSDYSYLCKIFHDLFVCKFFQHDYIFDWIILKYQKND